MAVQREPGSTAGAQQLWWEPDSYSRSLTVTAGAVQQSGAGWYSGSWEVQWELGSTVGAQQYSRSLSVLWEPGADMARTKHLGQATDLFP